uniref:L-lysine 2,3-aminomutase n=1 Tax=Magnetococcus massalia (strain MO-1) TaxID=451514 RepID=A0A1S7LCV3_MAGMO|nr:putative lysine aminomutase(kamA family) [Candidatus Magnetococcus massalia]
MDACHTPPPLTELEQQATDAFPLRMSPAFQQRINWMDPADPLRLQIWPHSAELEEVEGFQQDPLQEQQSSPTQGLIQKYAGRALVQLTDACPINCRYCFRRHQLVNAPKGEAQWQQLWQQLAAQEDLQELIFSGGDPLMLPAHRLQQAVAEAAALPQLKRLRIHSRVPVADPQRIDTTILQALTGTRLTPILVIHSNHPQELDETTAQALQQCREAGMLLLNQSVLLRGINDQAAILKQLSERLIELGVTPYYLHMLDRVTGTAHFEVGLQQAQRIMQQLHQQLPGYALPKLVREEPGKAGKTDQMWG